MRKLALAIAIFGAAASAEAADIVTDWSATIRKVMQQDGTHPVHQANPGWSTRSMAMMNTAIYDVFQAFDRTHKPFLVDTRAQANTSRDAAVHQAAYEVLLNCYPGEKSMLDADFNARMAAIPGGVNKTNGINLGSSIAQACITNRSGDNSNVIMSYTPGTQPGQWRGDPFNPGQSAWGPGWGTVHTFGIPNTADFVNALAPIPTLNSPAYTDAFNMVKSYGAMNSTVRTAEQTKIGLFWAYDRPSMGPPPVLFARNLEEIAEQTGNTPAQNARLFAMASVAQADAATASWDAKFKYNFWRPVAGIQEADADGNPATIADPTWRPLGAPGGDPLAMNDDFTPPFPAWTSGHATMGGAWFKSIELFYGTNVYDEIDGIVGNDLKYSLTSEEAGGGSTRDFSTFTQTGLLDVGTENSPEGENGMSRVYLGVHWIFDQRDGITLGNSIANYVAANHFQAVPEPSTLALCGCALAGIAWTAMRRRKVG
jgi:hypothetical protein